MSESLASIFVWIALESLQSCCRNRCRNLWCPVVSYWCRNRCWNHYPNLCSSSVVSYWCPSRCLNRCRNLSESVYLCPNQNLCKFLALLRSIIWLWCSVVSFDVRVAVWIAVLIFGAQLRRLAVVQILNYGKALIAIHSKELWSYPNTDRDLTQQQPHDEKKQQQPYEKKQQKRQQQQKHGHTPHTPTYRTAAADSW